MQRNRNVVISATENYIKDFENKRLDFIRLLNANKLLTNFKDVRENVQQRFKTIFVDEYQDTNQLQSELIENLIPGKCHRVGDDAQSIYSFRAARIENILEFENRFSAKRITLDVNYRCPKNILKWQKHL